MAVDLDLDYLPPMPARHDFGIGAVGAGFIMRDVQIPAYARAGFRVIGITSRTEESASRAAALRQIPKTYRSLGEMLEDPEVQILDLAVPPDAQLEIVREAVEKGRYVKGILAQKPLAGNYPDACATVALCKQAGLPLAVNQNMRYDHSIRALKTVLQRGYLGEPVLGTIEMRAVPHWQSWLRNYRRLTLLNMSVHHIDCFRFLFGDPEAVYVSARKDPRTDFPHEDGICLYILEYGSGLRASAWDDVWTGPQNERDNLNPYIKWRVEGTRGVAEGTIGWPNYPNHTPSTMTFTTLEEPGVWFTPRWKEAWFPDAFAGPMADFMSAVAAGAEPAGSGLENLGTMAVVEAAYQSLRERRAVLISEISARNC